MKRYVLTALLFLNVSSGFAQESYFVTVVKGIVSKADGSAIKTGSKLLLTDKVNMASKESLLILLHPSKGRIVLSPQAANVSKDNKFVLLVKDFLDLNQKNVRLSSRALDNMPVVLEDYFKTDPDINSNCLVIDTLKINLAGTAYTNADNKENFFFLQLSSARPVNHKLMVRNKILYITREDISFNDSLYKKTAGQLNLGYIENYSGDKKAKFITVIDPVYITREACIKVIRDIKLALKGRTEKEILDELYTQIYYLYGKPDEQALAEIYSSSK
jgi:hypothetical protein